MRARIRRRSILNGFQTWIHQKFPPIDWLLFVSVVGLTFLGGLMIRSAELHTGAVDWWQHWLFGAVGTVLALYLSRCQYQSLLNWHWLTYALTNLSLLVVLAIGVGAEQVGSQSWVNIGSFNIQPSEFAKVGVIITLAALLHKFPADNLWSIARVLGVTAVPWLLIMAQPDLGTGLVFGAITLGMLYWANAKLGWIVLLLSPLVSAFLFNLLFPGWIVWMVAVVAIALLTLPWRYFATVIVVAVNVAGGKMGSVLWGLLKEYQKDRLTLFLHPEKNPLGGGYQLIQSRIAIGSGEWLGRGLHRGTQTQLNFIPEQHTDFIFSVVGEEFGFIGSMLVLLTFFLICWRLIVIATTARENFGSLLAIGVLSMVAFQTIINISMTVGLAPITGIPLPWMSYGRSSLLTNFIALGLVEAVAFYRPRKRVY
jgi:rod shape determining protein RodA